MSLISKLFHRNKVRLPFEIPQGIPSSASGDGHIEKPKRNLIKYYGKQILALTIFAAIVFGISLMSMLFNKNRSVLTINTLPEDATIEISGQRGTSPLTKRLVNGQYTITVTKEGFQTKEEKINLNKNTEVTIALVQNVPTKANSSNVENIRPFEIGNISPISGNVLYAIDRQTGGLLRIEGSTKRKIYTGTVTDYSYNGSLVSVLDKSQQDKVTIINTETYSSQRLNVQNISPVFATAITPDASELFLLGSYLPLSGRFSVYKSKIAPFEPNSVYNTDADSIEALDSNTILLFRTPEAPDSGYVSIVDLNNSQEKYRSNATSYGISPDGKRIAIVTTKEVSFYTVETGKVSKRSFENTGRFTWRDNNGLIFLKNNYPGVELFFFDSNTLGVSDPKPVEQLKDSSLRTLVGVVGTTLYATDRDGNLVEINFE